MLSGMPCVTRAVTAHPGRSTTTNTVRSEDLFWTPEVHGGAAEVACCVSQVPQSQTRHPGHHDVGESAGGCTTKRRRGRPPGGASKPPDREEEVILKKQRVDCSLLDDGVVPVAVVGHAAPGCSTDAMVRYEPEEEPDGWQQLLAPVRNVESDAVPWFDKSDRSW